MLLVIKNSSGFRLKPGCDLSGRLAATFLSGARVADNYRVASCGCTMIHTPKMNAGQTKAWGFSITVSHKSHSALVNFRHVSSSQVLIGGVVALVIPRATDGQLSDLVFFRRSESHCYEVSAFWLDRLLLHGILPQMV